MPPTPTPAMFSRSLGGVNPLPSTWRGTIVKAAPVAAALVRNARREIVFFACLDPCLRFRLRDIRIVPSFRSPVLATIVFASRRDIELSFRSVATRI